MIRGILIDPWVQTITERAVSEHELLEPLLGGQTALLPGESAVATLTWCTVLAAGVVHASYSPVGGEAVGMWCDKAHMLQRRQAFFDLVYKGELRTSFGGRVIVVGADGRGDMISTTLTLDMVTSKVRFVPLGERR